MRPKTFDPWPALPWQDWASTATTLHLWTQIVGKIRTVRTPWRNHSWHVPLYLTARGLTTSPIPHGDRSFQVDFDLLDHRLIVTANDGGRGGFALTPMSVADFYRQVMETLDDLDLSTEIHPVPNEVEDPVPFPDDHDHADYDDESVSRFFVALSSADRVMKRFRARYLGKCSPVHFFWGSFDLAVTRFTGRTAPPHPGGIPNLPDWVTREAYSHEVSSAGFWPGGGQYPHPVFYSYAYPTAEGFKDRPVRPDQAFWLEELGEFVLKYEDVRTAEDPEAMLLAFLESTWQAAAAAGGWDRQALEASHPGVPARYRE